MRWLCGLSGCFVDGDEGVAVVVWLFIEADAVGFLELLQECVILVAVQLAEYGVAVVYKVVGGAA